MPTLGLAADKVLLACQVVLLQRVHLQKVLLPQVAQVHRRVQQQQRLLQEFLPGLLQELLQELLPLLLQMDLDRPRRGQRAQLPLQPERGI